jgi:hypothetical protein
MPTDGNPERKPYTRRDALKALSAVSGVAVVAGCGGNGDGGSDGGSDGGADGGSDGGSDGGADGGSDGGSDSTPTQQMVSQPLRWAAARSGDPLTDHEVNPFNPKNYDETVRLVYARLGGQSLTTEEWMDLDEVRHNDSNPSMFDQEANEQRLTIKDGVHWHRGTEIVDEVTAEDFKLSEELARRMTPQANRPENPMVVGWEVEGDNNKTLVRKLNPDGWNANLANGLWRIQIDQYRDGWYAGKLEEIKNASTVEARNSIRTEIQERSNTLSDDPLLSGPWMLESVNQNKAEFKRNPEHWSAGETNFDSFQLVRLGGGGNSGYQGLATDRIDIEQGGLPSAVSNVPQNVAEVSSAPGANFGWTFVINYGGDKVDPWLHADQDNGVVPARAAKIRQAIAHVISGSEIIKNQLGSRAASAISPWEKQTIIGTPAARERFPDVVSKLETTAGQNTDVAAQRMRDAGLSKEDGMWVKPNSETVSMTIQSYASNRAMFETIKEDLNSFGLDVEHSTPESSVTFSELGKGSFGAAQVWTSANGPFEGEVQSRFDPAAWYDSRRVVDYKIPPEIGDYEGEATETFNAGEAWQQLATQSVEENSEVLPKIIWTFAYHMPVIILFPYPNQTMVNTRHFQFPQPMPEKASNGVATATEDHHPVWGATENWRQLRRGIPSITGKTQ